MRLGNFAPIPLDLLRRHKGRQLRQAIADRAFARLDEDLGITLHTSLARYLFEQKRIAHTMIGNDV